MDTQLSDEGTGNPVENTRAATPRAAHPGKPKRPQKKLQAQAAFDQVFERSRALSKDDLVAVNIDVPKTVLLALGALPGLLALRSELAELPQFEIENLDLLEAYVLALSHAHAKASASTARVDESTVKARAIASRDTPLVDSAALAARGLISAKVLKTARAECYTNLPFGLLCLVTLLRNEWPKICNRTCIAEAELVAAAQLAAQLINQPGDRQRATTAVAERLEQRQRNLTLLVRAYAQLRRAVAYLYWQDGAVDRLAPSLYRGRGNHVRAPREASSSGQGAALGQADLSEGQG